METQYSKRESLNQLKTNGLAAIATLLALQRDASVPARCGKRFSAASAKGLIFRGKRLVNWNLSANTGSDTQVFHE